MSVAVWAVQADWMDIYTIPQFLKDVDPKFQYKGEGWYIQKDNPKLVDSTMLVRRTADTHDEPCYEFFVWNGRDPRQEIKEGVANLLKLPVREE